jgi:ribosome-associated heat shock protein Hsp15
MCRKRYRCVTIKAVEAVRLDRWLWSVRVYKTRSQATDACRAGHVRVNRASAKPAHTVRVGDRVTLKGGGWERDREVAALVDKRVGPPAAAACVVDHSGPPPPREQVVTPLFGRDPSAGRPTKRDRRSMDRLRGR